jgi:serine/threonine protein phosphatase PrpC
VKQKLAHEKVSAAGQQAKEEPDAGFSQASSALSLAQRVRCFWSRSPIGIAHMQGRRKEMEDEDLISSFSLKNGEKAQVYGIFDGHGGSDAAQFAKKNLTPLLQKALDRYGSSDEGVFAAFKEAFAELDRYYRGDAGSTLNVAIRIGDALWVCNVGDTRAILVEEGEVTQLSKDQSPDDPQIKRGIIKRGGVVLNRGCPRVGGIIAVGRALGDRCAVGMVHTPKITKFTVTPGAHLVIACDGIWDVASTTQAGAFIQECIKKKFSCKEMAERLIHKAFNAGSKDNLSALVVRL